jgi:hypothetical protein
MTNTYLSVGPFINHTAQEKSPFLTQRLEDKFPFADVLALLSFLSAGIKEKKDNIVVQACYLFFLWCKVYKM